MVYNLIKSEYKKKEKNKNHRNRKLGRKRYTSKKITRNTSRQQGGADAPKAAAKPKKKMQPTGNTFEEFDLDDLMTMSIPSDYPQGPPDIVQPAIEFMKTHQLKYFEDERNVNEGIENTINAITISETSDLTLKSLESIQVFPRKK